jgi:hypothetical protein
MGSRTDMKGKLREAFSMNADVKEIYDLTKLSDEELYRTMGSAARETKAILKEGSDHLRGFEGGDPEGKSPFLFRNLREAIIPPTVYFNIPDDPLDAGILVYGQLAAKIGRVICSTIKGNPLHGYRQEYMRLARKCKDAVESEYPNLDNRIIKGFVALQAKHDFSDCRSW